MIRFDAVLVAADFDDASATALAYGRTLARAFGARLHVLHVVDDVKATTAAAFHPDTFEDMQVHVEKGARHRLDALLTDGDRETLHATAVVRVSSAIPNTIVEYARTAHVDLIIVGTHGRGVVSRVLLGSVAEKVVRTAPCPVLVVRPDEHDFIAPEPIGVQTHL